MLGTLKRLLYTHSRETELEAGTPRALFGAVRIALLIVTFITLISVATLTGATPVYAAPNDSKAECDKVGGKWEDASGGGQYKCAIPKWSATEYPSKRAKSYSYYYALKNCMSNFMQDTITTKLGDGGATTPSQGTGKANGEWFNGGSGQVAALVYPDGKMNCDQLAKKSMDLWGYSSGKDFLIAVGFSFDPKVPKYTAPSDKGDGLRKAVLAKVGNVVNLNNDSSKYLLYRKAFTDSSLGACKAKQVSVWNSTTDPSIKNRVETLKDKYAVVSIVDAGGTEVKEYVYEFDGKVDSEGIGVSRDNYGVFWSRGLTISASDGNKEGYTCKELIAGMNKTAPKYADWNIKNPDKAKDTKDNIADGVSDATDEAAPTCVIDGVGWLLCPIVEFVAAITDKAYDAVAVLLETPPLFTTGDNSGAYQAWKVMQGFANAAFVVVFIIIIYSQLTSTGVSNYGVKRMLPRLIIGALLVNISFFICAIAVDVSNIIGSSVKPLIDNISIPAASIAEAGATSDNMFGAISTYVLAGAGVAAGTVFLSNATLLGALALLVPGLVAAVVAILTVLIVLVLRQALIVLLVVASPLAFVAFLLPNTESLFTKWRKLLTTLLLMYPIIAAIFGLSGLASTIVMNSASGDLKLLTQIAGALIMVIPLAITPLVMKTAGNVLGRVGMFVNNKEKGLFDRAKNGAAGFRKNQSELRSMRALNGKRSGVNGAFTRMRARRGAINQGRKSELARAQAGYISNYANENDNYADLMAGGGRLGVGAAEGAASRAQARATATLAKLDKEDLDGAIVELTGKIDKVKLAGGNPDTELMKIFSNGGSGIEAKAAINMLAAQGRDGAIRTLQASAAPAQKEAIQDAITSNGGALVGKAPDLVKGTEAAFSNMDGKTMSGLSAGTASEYVKHLGGLFSSASAPGATQQTKDSFNKAMSGFMSSIEDIKRDPSLQGSFKNDVGLEIKNAFSSAADATFRAYSPSSIDTTGKIR